MEESYFNSSKERSIDFYIALAIILLFFILTLNTDLAMFSSQKETGIPSWFPSSVLVVDALILVSLILVYFYRKIGVYLFPVFALIHHVLYEFYLTTTLLSGLHLIFVFIGVGLLVIIPRWRAYR